MSSPSISTGEHLHGQASLAGEPDVSFGTIRTTKEDTVLQLLRHRDDGVELECADKCKICGKTIASSHHYCSSCLALLRAKERQLKKGASEHPELFFKEELTILSLDNA